MGWPSTPRSLAHRALAGSVARLAMFYACTGHARAAPTVSRAVLASFNSLGAGQAQKALVARSQLAGSSDRLGWATGACSKPCRPLPGGQAARADTTPASFDPAPLLQEHVASRNDRRPVFASLRTLAALLVVNDSRVSRTHSLLPRAGLDSLARRSTALRTLRRAAPAFRGPLIITD